jgi:chromosome partitioning protein
MALMGRKVLLIDLDGQANLTLYFMPNADDIEVSIFDSMVEGVPLPIHNVKENLDIVMKSKNSAELWKNLVRATRYAVK